MGREGLPCLKTYRRGPEGSRLGPWSPGRRSLSHRPWPLQPRVQGRGTECPEEDSAAAPLHRSPTHFDFSPLTPGPGVTAEKVIPAPSVFCEGDHRSTLTCISPDGTITVRCSGCSPAIMSGILAADLESRLLAPGAGFRAKVIRHTFCFRTCLFRAWLSQPSSSSSWPWFTVNVDIVIYFSS